MFRGLLLVICLMAGQIYGAGRDSGLRSYACSVTESNVRAEVKFNPKTFFLSATVYWVGDSLRRSESNDGIATKYTTRWVNSSSDSERYYLPTGVTFSPSQDMRSAKLSGLGYQLIFDCKLQ